MLDNEKGFENSYENYDDNIIEIDNLSKTFGDVKAVDNLSFRVKTG